MSDFDELNYLNHYLDFYNNLTSLLEIFYCGSNTEKMYIYICSIINHHNIMYLVEIIIHIVIVFINIIINICNVLLVGIAIIDNYVFFFYGAPILR